MDEKEVQHAAVRVVRVEGITTIPQVADVVSGFSHSFEVNAFCADVDRPHVITFVEKDALERAAEEYIERKGLGKDDAYDLRVWLEGLSDGVGIAILESSP